MKFKIPNKKFTITVAIWKMENIITAFYLLDNVPASSLKMLIDLDWPYQELWENTSF